MRPVLHAVFDVAATGHLMQVLGRARRDGIICLSDDLSIGPIDKTDGEARTRWLQEQFGSDAYENAADIDAFWSEVASPANRIVAWVSRYNAGEHAGLLELLRRRGDEPFEVVDVTDVQFAGLEDRPGLASSLGIGELGAAQVIERKLLETAAPLSATATLGYAQLWARLRQENALLRIVENATLVSAPINCLDARLLSFAAPEWRSTGLILDPFYRTARAAGFDVPDLRFILSRLAALVESGQLEGEGDVARLDGMQSRQFRRPR
jgi:hypothetical protein